MAKAKSTEKKVVFLSHAWEDRVIVQPFKDAFFGETNPIFDQSQYECFYTSDPLNPSISSGKNIWQEIEQKLFRCKHFIAFCSPNYFKSQTCQNELGAIKALAEIAPRSAPIHMLPVKLADFNSKYFNHIINPTLLYKDLFNSQDVAALAKALGAALQSSPADTDYRYEEVAAKAIEARDKLAQSKDHRIVSFWKKHLDDKSYPNTPVTFFIELCQYPDVAVDLSEKGVRSLVWSLNRSPLLATAAYADPSSYLMDHERRFESLKASKKCRLVIFKDWKEAEAYQLCDSTYHNGQTGGSITHEQLEQRRKKFQESVGRAGAQLRFTTRSRIKNSAIFRYADSLGEDYWDFGYVKTGDAADAEFLFASGFDSHSFGAPSACLHSKAISHLALYSKPHEDRYEVLRKPPYEVLYGPFRGLFDVVDSLLDPSDTTANVFVTEEHISKLKEAT